MPKAVLINVYMRTTKNEMKEGISFTQRFKTSNFLNYLYKLHEGQYDDYRSVFLITNGHDSRYQYVH